MIEFRCRLRDKTFTPIISNNELRDYAEAVAADYKPALLKEPGIVNGVHFLENYLGAAVEFQDLYYDEGKSPIAGAAVFSDGKIPVFDRENMCVGNIAVRANTVILDNMTVKEGKEGFANFTALHEGGHLSIHSEVYRASRIVCCRKANLERVSPAQTKQLTPEQSREHQANVFAAFVAMPRQTFVPFAGELIREAGFENGVFIHDDKAWESDYALSKVIRALQDAYGASYTAVKIHLHELNLLMTKYEYESRAAQGNLF